MKRAVIERGHCGRLFSDLLVRRSETIIRRLLDWTQGTKNPLTCDAQIVQNEPKEFEFGASEGI